MGSSMVRILYNMISTLGARYHLYGQRTSTCDQFTKDLLLITAKCYSIQMNSKLIPETNRFGSFCLWRT